MMRLGVDLGGTKIEIVALDERGAECYRQRIATPYDDYSATLTAIVDLVHDAERELGTPGSVGIATPGTISSTTGLIKNANSTCLNGQPLQDDLEEALQRDIRIENDANCFALSEATDGAAAGAEIVFGVILGTGVGGGIVVNGKSIVGINAIAGEWGHNPLPWPRADELPGVACYCGRAGGIEPWLSGPTIARRFLETDGRALDATMIARAAGEGDANAITALDDYCDRLARGLASIINVLDPDVIVLGGGLSNIAALYARVPTKWGEYIFSDSVSTRLVPPKFGASSGVRGAAWLWND